jgi:hypothetical protein
MNLLTFNIYGRVKIMGPLFLKVREYLPNTIARDAGWIQD